VNDDILLDKLCYYGIHGSALLWSRSYLENSRQRVEILHNEFGKTSSSWETIKDGVPQGSILGPFLCLQYITSILISGPVIQYVQSKPLIELDSINKWCMTSGLSLNLKKTKIMQFESNQQIRPLIKLHIGINR
jgi:hypothetical protein